VSYASSPPAEIVYASDPKPDKPFSSVMESSCFRQVEYAGVLAGTKNPEAARAVVDWLLSPEVQADVPLSMFVFPAVDGTPLPDSRPARRARRPRARAGRRGCGRPRPGGSASSRRCSSRSSSPGRC